MNFWRHLEQTLTEHTGEPFSITDHHGVGGGCINEAWIIQGDRESYFVKTNRAELLDMFEAEAEGLSVLLETGAIRVPRPVCRGVAEDRAYLVLEYIHMGGRQDPRRFGRQLAELHQCTSDRFGWRRDNTIGATPQINDWSDDWLAFWRHQRLGYQLGRATKKGLSAGVIDKGELLKEKLGGLFCGYSPRPSPLHGDLWSGNWSSDEQGNPVIFDPAFYYGDHEADLAMMELFGNPGRGFHAAYREVFPIDPGYPQRRDLYNLYHILNHYNLFGGGYAGQAERLIDKLLVELLNG